MPGDTALTRIVGAYSSAAVAVSAATAALAAAYGASPADGRVPEIDAVDTIAPPPDSRMSGATGLEAVEHAGEVEVDDAVPLGELVVVDRATSSCRPRCCRAARARRAARCASSAAACSASKSVTSTRVRDAVDLLGDLFGAVAVQVDDGDLRALGGHAAAGRRADTRCAAGDERALTVEQTHRRHGTRGAGRATGAGALT